MTSVDLTSAKERFGAAIWAIHRVDLHKELLRLATGEPGPGSPVTLHLSSEIIEASTEGSVTLLNGSKFSADLVVAGDGLHSVLKGAVVEEAIQPATTELSAFRFLIDTQKIKQSVSASTMLDKKGPEATLLADVNEVNKERHIIWYPCRE